MLQRKKDISKGFTIVEVAIVIVCIGILAGIVALSYNGVSRNAKETSLKADLVNSSAKITEQKTNTGSMPSDTSNLPKKDSTSYTSYVHNDANRTFCLTAQNTELPGVSLRITETGTVDKGTCADLPVKAGDSLQNITTASCPTTRTLVVDGRDRNSYWVQKLADNRCWMLTNLAYAGGGNNAYGDVKTMTDASSLASASYTVPYYSVVAQSNATTYPAQPTTTTDGGTTNPQFGYFYNWCAALGAQTGTSSCANASSPSYNASTSICPAGWRLPTGNSSGEIASLVSAIGATNNTAGANIARSTLLFQRAGNFRITHSPGSYGYWWSSTQYAANQGYMIGVGASSVGNGTGTGSKDTGFSVRCIAV